MSWKMVPRLLTSCRLIYKRHTHSVRHVARSVLCHLAQQGQRALFNIVVDAGASRTAGVCAAAKIVKRSEVFLCNAAKNVKRFELLPVSSITIMTFYVWQRHWKQEHKRVCVARRQSTARTAKAKLFPAKFYDELLKPTVSQELPAMDPELSCLSKESNTNEAIMVNPAQLYENALEVC